MRKRILSLLLCCVMLIGLLPTTAFAEDSAEEPLVCSCETACTVDNMNKECPVCGAENAIPQNCGQYIPVEDRTGENGSTEGADDPNGPIELSAADQVQAMINGLPNAEEITEDNAEEVEAQLEAIDEAKEKLSDEEIDELDMTRYAEAAAALGALAAPMLLANNSPDEQFSLTPGGRYYFDLSAMNIPGKVNGRLPDSTLHYVPFTYVGTVNAYKLTSETATTEEDAQREKYPHSLFIADYAVTHTVSWDNLNTKSLIFGKDYVAGGVGLGLPLAHQIARLHGGQLLLKNIIPKHMDCISAKLMEMGVTVEEEDDTLLIRRTGPLLKANVKTLPYPGFPTDMQPQITAVLALAEGTSLVTEGVYGANRFKYVDELKRLGARIQVDGKVAVLEGVDHFTGAPVQAPDLRAGAALVIAALAAHGTTEISHVQYIERGYEDIVGKLRAVGADISMVDEPETEKDEARIG